MIFSFSWQYLSKPLLQVFRDETQTAVYRTSQHKYLCTLLRAVEVRCLKTTDLTSAMHFEHGTLIEIEEQRAQSSLLGLSSRDEILLCDIVNTIRNNPEDYPEWHSSKTAELYSPEIFVNKKCDKGYWF